MIFQLVFGCEEWLKFYIVEYVVELVCQGIIEIVVILLVFFLDCIEMLEEIQGEICEVFEYVGGKEFIYIFCLNVEFVYIDVLIMIIGENLVGWI